MTMLFTKKDGTTPILNLHLHAAAGKEPKNKRIYLTGAGDVRADLAIASSNTNSVSANIIKTPYDAPKGMWTVDLSLRMPGIAIVQATHGPDVALVSVQVDDRVVLPVREPFAMLAKLFLAENLTPEQPGYSFSEVWLSMQWMRIVLENRRSNPQKFFAANGTLEAIVQAPGQFAGFTNYPTIGSDQQNLLLTILNRANDDEYPKQNAYAQLVAAAVSIATLPPATDPCPTGLYGWRMGGSSAPGGDLVAWQKKAGNQFYTLESKKKKK
jgi:hypothetical protein